MSSSGCPVKAAFVVREVAGKGLGVVAIKDIHQGALIISEKPLFVVPWWVRHSAYSRKELQRRLDRILDDLSDYDEQAYFSLADCKSGQLRPKTAMGIWKTNNFALGRSSGRSDNGIFPKLSRFNHSCVPSAEFWWNSAQNRQEIRAIRDIMAGEEITLCYCTYNFLVQPAKQRRSHLLAAYGFLCDCPHCSLPVEQEEINDQMRQRVKDLDQLMEQLIYEWVDVSEEEVAPEEEEGEVGADDAAALQDLEKALDAAKEWFSLMQHLGFKVICLLDACQRIVELAQDLQHHATAQHYARKGFDLAHTLYGSSWSQNLGKLTMWQKWMNTTAQQNGAQTAP